MAVIVLAGGALAGIASLALVDATADDLTRWLTDDPSRFGARLRFVVWVFAFAVCAPMLLFATYLWRLGTRVLLDGRFPPARMAVLADVVVLRNGEARARGRVMRILAVLLAAASVGLAGILLRLSSLPPSHAP